MSTTSSAASTLDALRYLSGHCDGARTWDGQGFNKYDSDFGHSLAGRDHLTDRQEFAALKMLRKYRRQLEGGGFDLDAMFLAFAQRDKTQEAPTTGRRIDVEGDLFVIHSPYDARLVEEMRRVPERRWVKERKVNTVPVDQCLEVERFGKENGFAFTEEALAVIADQRVVAEAERRRVENVIAASTAQDSDIQLTIEGLRPFQRAGVEYALDRRRTFLGDEMGLGKSVQALATVDADEAYPLLIICPKTVVPSWRKELHKWLPDRGVQVIDNVRPFHEGFDISIIHYDALASRIEVLMRSFKSLIVDESHFVKNYKAKRTKIVQHIADRLEGDDPLILLLTGTPVLNRPVELITQLTVMRRIDEFGGAKHFYRYYCGSNQRGAQNLNELNVELRGTCMVRRLKKDVLTELPERDFSDVPTDLDNEQEYRYAEAAFLRWYAEQGKDAARAARAEMLVRLGQLRGLAARGKLANGIQWCKDFMDGDGKLLIFAWSREAQSTIFRELAAYNPRRITAEMDADERGRQVEQFQTDDSVRAFVMPLDRRVAVGTTLHAASNAAFFELAWSPGDMLQALDRLHRIGQQFAVMGYRLIAEDTVDDLMAEILTEKQEIMDQIHDGTAAAELQDESIYDELVDRMLRRRS